MPELADALANGDTTGERVDTFANATAGLKPDELDKVAEHGALIAAAAANSTERQYRETIERLIGRARGDDGFDSLARQRRATGFRWWTNQHTGMWHCAGQFDPVRGTELEGRLRNALEALFHGKKPDELPDDLPTDPTERQDHLAALALLALSEGKGTSGLPDVTVLIDEKTLARRVPARALHRRRRPRRFGLPIETIRRWACIGTVNPVVVGADGVRLFLGRETRLANRAQRRALRVLYRTCALCEVPFEHTQAHHVSWYGLQQGLTDIDNLLPLCIDAPPPRPRRRLATHPRTRPHPHRHPTRRPHHHPRPTQSPRRLTAAGVASADATVRGTGGRGGRVRASNRSATDGGG